MVDIAENRKKLKQKWNLYASASAAAEKDESVQHAIPQTIGEESLDIYNAFRFHIRFTFYVCICI